MTNDARVRVPGEGVPVIVPTLMLAAGVLLGATAAGVARASTTQAPPPTPTEAKPPPAEPASTTLPAVSVPAASTPRHDLTPHEQCGKLVVEFASGAASGPAAANAPLIELGEYVRSTSGAHVLVEGHADAVGDEISNLRLSRARAAWVAARLQDAGVPRARITVRGLGAFSPVGGVPETESANRRVVVTAGGAPGCAPVPEEEIR